MVVMAAKWRGRCRVCGVALPPGTQIEWTKEAGARHVNADACAAALANPPKEMELRAARPLPPDEFERLRSLLWAARWRTASSMPSIPHSYTLRKWWDNDEDFQWVIAALRRSGYHQTFGSRIYLYTDVDEYQVFDAAAAGPEETWIDVMELDPRPGREGQYKVAGINRAVRRPAREGKLTRKRA
jgi:hypothetical protein